MRIMYCGNFSATHCTEVHVAETLEDLGHEVLRVQEAPTSVNTLMDRIGEQDLFMFTRTWNTLLTLEHLKYMRSLGIPSMSYHLDLYVGLQRESGLDGDPFWSTDFVMTPDGSEQAAAVFKQRGINHHYIKPGVYKAECRMAEPTNFPLHDVLFVGGGIGYGHPEWPYRSWLVQWLIDTYGPKFGKYGYPEETVRNWKLNQLYANSKVVVGDSLCLNFDHPYYWSDRVYETMGRGGFIIHPYIKGMEEEFIDGFNIVFYEFNDWTGLRQKIDHYVAIDDERNAIRDIGHEYVRNNCTYHNRLTQALQIVHDHA